MYSKKGKDPPPLADLFLRHGRVMKELQGSALIPVGAGSQRDEVLGGDGGEFGDGGDTFDWIWFCLIP